MLRLAAALPAALLLASAARAEPVWRSYAPVVPVAGFAYSGPGNAVWRLWRERTVASAPPPSATVAEKVAGAEPNPVLEVGPVEPTAVAAPAAAAKPAAPTAAVEPPPATTTPAAVAEPPSAPAWSPGAQVSLAALVIAAFAVIVFLVGRRGERTAS